ncbi:alpha/beta hydrolase fold domain-containing protein [Modestobacter sp. I12A-02628]|uniref:Alpha/beta hydrolase n=1 Tax=Goekera deserti TaxID=2497753 RepID=A0A7K3WB66_9ACTN|nr:alpha/beta hydrolase [Goekera deserti]MPQ97429.1 alpha/beta hydrolase fold domain-containing protein [Goekera deserti]NDI47970.1 alpha/beta hydrolase fold domain-containing protein [Goekera deserti]NEL53718.1 alpha/beta hydrolase [Goekera deserti]
MSRTTTRAGLTYATRPGSRPLQLDLHLPPEGAHPAPFVVFAHGGGWSTGSRDVVGPGFADWSPSPFDRLAAAGIAVATVDYRLSGESTWPAPLEDVVAALRWLRGNSTRLGLDADRVALWGESAGGHLAAMAGLLGHDPDRGAGRVRAVVDWYGPADLLGLSGQLGPGAPHDPDAADSRESMLLGAPLRTVPELAADASPVHHVTAGAPPFLLVHGRADRLVPARQSELLAAALADHGVPVRLEVLDGADHLWTGSEDAPAVAFDLTTSFLLEHLT